MSNPGLTDVEVSRQLSRRSHVGLSESDRERLVAEITARATGRPWRALLPRRLVAIGTIVIAGLLVAVALLSPSLGTAPRTADDIVTGQDLVPMVAAARDSGSTTTVLANVTVDRKPVYSLLGPICRQTPCDLPVGFVKVTGVPDLVVRALDDSGFGAFFGADDLFHGVLALNVTRAGLEFLGVVDGGVIRDPHAVPGTNARDGLVEVVRGYLRTADCPDTRVSAPSAAASCAFAVSFIADHPAATGESDLVSQLPVQGDVAPYAALDGVAAAYVIAPSSQPIAKWQVVGRVGQVVPASSPSPSPAPSPVATDVTVLSLEQLKSELQSAASDGRQRTVIAYVALEPSSAGDYPPPTCAAGLDGCPEVVGDIKGVPGIPVWAEPAVADSLRSVEPRPSEQVLALRFGKGDAITLLGVVSMRDSATVLWPASESALEPMTEGIPGLVVGVHGWLNSSGPLPCPRPASPTPPPNTPFVTCPFNWISADRQPPMAGTVSVPPDSIRVQPFAYDQYTCPDGNGSSQCGFVPVEGTWLLQLVEDPRQDANPKRGWQVVGRLDEGIQPSPSPTPSSAGFLLPDDPQLHDPSAQAVGTKLDVRGWLVDTPATIFCSMILPPKTPPPDIYESSCPGGAWITKDHYQPWTSDRGAFDINPPDPSSSVRVQRDAYHEFAPDPQAVDGGAHAPRLGTYELELIRDPRFPDDGALGWKLVQRLDP